MVGGTNRKTRTSGRLMRKTWYEPRGIRRREIGFNKQTTTQLIVEENYEKANRVEEVYQQRKIEVAVVLAVRWDEGCLFRLSFFVFSFTFRISMYGCRC